MKVEEKFQELKYKKEGAYMAHIYYGDPNEDFSIEEIKTLVKNGADFIEFGIPFSDPTADGPTFQAACQRALENGMTPLKCIEGLEKIDVKVPIVVTTYYNIPYVFGVGRFIKRISKAGAKALIVPNVPIEEAELLLEEGRKEGVSIIFLVTPTTPNTRLKKIVDVASGFIYVVSVEGVTGARDTLKESTIKLVKRVRKYSDIPLMAGFGISRKEHAKAVVSAGADGVITGSILSKIVEKNLDCPHKALPEIARIAREIKQGCKEGYMERLVK